MGIESDQLVLDYLSRVGDLAQQRQLPSGDRMRLVSELRREIEQQRTHAADSTGAVKRILGKLGTPDEVVRAAGGRGAGAGPGGTRPDRPEHRPATERTAPASPAAPGGAAGDGGNEGDGGGDSPGRGALRKLTGFARRTGFTGAAPGSVPEPRSGKETPPEPPVVPVVPLDGPMPPHLAGEDELGPRGEATDWWRAEPGPFGGGRGAAGAGWFGPGESVPGFVGGIEIPEILKPPPQDPFRKPPAPGETAPEADDGTTAEERVRRPGLLRRRRAGGGSTASVTHSPLLLLAAALLIGGAVFGQLIALGLGWLLAYAGPRLSRTEARFAALVLPGIVAGGAAVWLWGRQDGRWGAPVANGELGAAFTETWPVTLRVAAVATALYLVRRSRRAA